MIKKYIIILTRWAVRIRYSIVINELSDIALKDGEGALLLANHPAYIDPFIIFPALYKRFSQRVLIDENQLKRPGITFLIKNTGGLPIPDMSSTKERKLAYRQSINVIKMMQDAVDKGERVLLYPAGSVLRSSKECINQNGAVKRILRENPDTKIVLVRTKGLWGSVFSFAKTNQAPNLMKVLPYLLINILISLIFFVPKRKIEIEVMMPDDIPRGRNDDSRLNKYLENFFNEVETDKIEIPYSIWSRFCFR